MHHGSTAREAIEEAISLLEELHAIIKGEAPRLFDDLRDGNSSLEIRIEETIKNLSEKSWML